MATIIDSLLVTLGLDKKDYDRARQEVDKGLKETGERAKKSGQDVEGSLKNQGAAFAKLRGEVTGFLLTLAGAKSLTQFASNLVSTTAQLGRSAQVFGVNANEIAGWQAVVAGAGGTAEEATAAIAKLKDMQANFILHPDQIPGPQLAQLGFKGSPQQLAQTLGNPSEVFLHLADQYQKELSVTRAKGTPGGESMLQATFSKRLQETFGLSPAFINAIERGRPALEAELALAEQRANVTEENARAAEDFQRTLQHLQTALLGLARSSGTIETLDGVAQALEYVSGSSSDLGQNARDLAANFIRLLDPIDWLASTMELFGAISPATAQAIREKSPIYRDTEGWRNQNFGVGGGWDDASTQNPVGISGTGTRATRNNNPGNLKASAWVRRLPGFAGVDEGGFARFASQEAGFAAAERLVSAKIQQFGTLAGVIRSWAPPNENNTGAYINAVSRETGINPFQRLSASQAGALARAIARHEGYDIRRVASGAAGRAPAAPAQVNVHVDARGNQDPRAVGHHVERGVRRAMNNAHRVANANTGVN